MTAVYQILVTTTNSSVLVTVTDTRTVSVITAGPQGPKGLTGDPGPPGQAGAYAYVFQQAAPATTWTINHNLGYRPSVELLDSGSQEIDGDVSHPSINQTLVALTPATAGLARLI
jgi:hypothetical protein